MRNIQVLCLLLSLFINSLVAQNFNNGFNFVLPPFDGTSQNFLPEFPAYTITEAHRVTTGSDGKFYSNGQPIRFWGVNMTIGGNFPLQADAPLIATRMRKMGINLVRIHHFDNPSWGGPNNSIFRDGNQGTRDLNPVTLDRLEYFIAQLKVNGIFVDIELNVSREFQEVDGVLYADSLDAINKAETLFDPYIRDLQKEFAQQLLTHVNPYTGLSLIDDPVMAMLEMNNEATLVRYWKSDYLYRFNQGGLMLYRHEQMLNDRWQDWLVEKYGNDSNLMAAWESEPVNPNNLLENGAFEDGPLGLPWSLELNGTAEGTISLDNQNTYGGNAACRLDVTETSSAGWHIQFKNAGFSLEAGKTYELAFAARANGTYDITASAVRDNPPYDFYAGFDLTVTPNWQPYFFTFTMPEENNGNGRIALSPDNQLGQFWFDNFSVLELPREGLAANESLTNQNVRRILWSEKANYSKARVADMLEFYMSIQQEHFDDLRSYLVNTLNVRTPITGSNALAGPTDAATHENLDYLDDHSYWDSPDLLDDDFSSPNWLIRNDPMVRNDRFSAISIPFAGHAFADKPLTVSEYNHCFPNIYRAEMMPFILSYGLYHGMDGIMLFEYNSNRDWEIDQVDRYFSLHQDHNIMAMSPSFAYAFREGLVQENPNPIIINYSREWLYESAKVNNTSSWSPYTPIDKRLTFTHTVQVGTYDAPTTTDFTTLPSVAGSPYMTQTGETSLDTDVGLLETATDKFITIGGFLEEAAPTTSGNMTIIQADGFGVVSWLSLTNNPLTNTAKSILTLSSRIQNTNMIWNGDQTVNGNWGTAPTEIQPRQVTLRLNIDADYIRVYPLNELGAEQNSQQLFPISGNTFEIQLDQRTEPTLWWGIEAVGGTILSIDEALNLKAIAEKEKVRLDWQALSTNGEPFQVQRSTNLQQWKNIETVKANSRNTYQFFDKKPVLGRAYYRLEQQGKQEESRFSNIAEVTFSEVYEMIHLNPSPTMTQLQVEVERPLNTPLQWEIVDLNGTVIQTGSSRQKRWIINVSDLEKGMYFIRFESDYIPLGIKKVIKI